ncbi:MAG TPA: hypothetical protein CFH82_09480 [Sulfurospirillum sp. UBA12182]|jgi:hypothetical protein|nr:MAG TPA: hypothetical protein CFH82_09480 [Sulfurospirillum sp. UBA12182]
MTYTPEVITLLALDALFLILATLCVILSISIVRSWDMNATTSFQYTLEKRAVLVATFVKYIFFLKLPLFLFFIFTSDKISGVITGAMCAAGVVNSVSFGMYLLILKLINLYLFGLWLVLHVKDLKDEKRALTKKKFILFILGYLFLLIEVFYEFGFFNSLDIDKIVSCCGTLFSAATSSSLSLIFELENYQTLLLFYSLFALHLITLYTKSASMGIGSSVLFLIISIISLILFFGTYIYELPTHHCPFCFLQKDYYYVGYLIYVTLFCATFFSFSGGIIALLTQEQVSKKLYNISFVFTILFTLLVSAYPLIYFLRNGVWL